MTTAEIKALVDETKRALADFDPPLAPLAQPYQLIAAIETLLAREAEVMEEVGNEDGTFCYKCQSEVEFDDEYYCPQCGCYAFYHDSDRRIRAILNPETAK